MVVRPDGAFHGTIGGGQLEWRMLGRGARRARRGPRARPLRRPGARARSRPVLRRAGDGADRDVRRRRDVAALQACRASRGAAEIEAAFVRVQCALRCGRAGVETGRRAVDAGRPVATQSPSSDRRTSGARRRRPLTPVMLFGAGHVGRALVAGARAAALRGALDRRPRGRLSAAHSRRTSRPCATRDPGREIARRAADAWSS